MGVIRARAASVGDRTVEFALAGEGGLPVVLINGSGGHLDSWLRMFDSLATFGTVLAYNRPGVGKSSPSAEPQTVAVCTRDLLALIETVNVAAPWLVVGHSFGGLIASYLARSYPERIAGIVLLDATAADDVAASNQYAQSRRMVDRLGFLFAPKTQHSEVENARESVAQLSRAGPFPPVPLSVVSGSRSARGFLVPKAFQQSRSRNQVALAGESPHGQHIIAARSGHFPQITEPKLCVRVIAEMRSQLAGLETV